MIAAATQNQSPATALAPLPAPSVPVWEAFSRVASEHADRLAILTPADQCTYAQLRAMASGLRGLLRRQADVRGRTVCLIVENWVLRAAASLAVMAEGGIVVVLDPKLPVERLRFLAENSEADLLVSEPDLAGRAGELKTPEQRVVTLSRPDLDACLGAPEPGRGTLDDAAYIVYTSGSTGQPKGVVHTQANLVYQAGVRARNLALTSQDRCTALYAASAISCTYDLFGTLLRGACLAPFPFREQGFAALAEWIRARGITVYHSVPTVFRELTEALGEGGQLPSVRLAAVSGDQLGWSDMALFHHHFGAARVFCTALASSEAGPFAFWVVDRALAVPGQPLPCGRPLPEAHVHIVDERQRPVPPGEIGEIVVGSRYLSPGYWRRPDLTAQAFCSFPALGPGRFNRTGDFGRFDEQGRLVFLGRQDFQVKIRGNRVELGEVEAAVLLYPGIRQCVVVGREVPDRGLLLVAYLVADNPSSPPSMADLREFLSARLPEHSVPSCLVELEKLPLNANGKLDRRALPLPPDDPSGQDQGCVAPRTPTEEVVAAIWAEILGMARVGVTDSFLALGGQSVLALRVIAKIESACGVRLPIRVFFEKPTVAAMAAIIDAGGVGQAAEVAPVLPSRPGTLDVGVLSDDAVAAMLSELGHRET